MVKGMSRQTDRGASVHSLWNARTQCGSYGKRSAGLPLLPGATLEEPTACGGGRQAGGGRRRAVGVRHDAGWRHLSHERKRLGSGGAQEGGGRQTDGPHRSGQPRGAPSALRSFPRLPGTAGSCPGRPPWVRRQVALSNLRPRVALDSRPMRD
jgi:hypothetical protein